MNKALRAVAISLALALPTTALGADNPATGTVNPSTANSRISADELEGKMLPDLRSTDGIALNDLLNAVSNTVPEFQYVLARDLDDPETQLILPPMKSRNLTLKQFFSILQAIYPQLTVNRVDGPSSRLYVIRIDSVRRLSYEQIAAKNTIVKVYNLRSAITNLANTSGKTGSDTRASSLLDLMSLIQATMETGNSKPVLRLHQPTETLIFQGALKDARVIDQLLSEFDPTQSRRQIEPSVDSNKKNLLESSASTPASTPAATQPTK